MQGECASAEQPVLALDELDQRRVGLVLGQIKDCANGNVRLVALDSSVADYLVRLRVQDFPNLTVYYPVADEKPTAHRCDEVVTRAFPPPESICAEADMATEFSYQATLNAAGMGKSVVCEMRADPGGWITTSFQRSSPPASNPCAALR